MILCITAEYDLCGSIILEILHDVTVCLRKYTNNRTFFQKNHAAPHQVIKKCTTDAILTINAGFARYMGEDSSQGEELPISIKVNTVNGTRGSIGSKYLSACVSSFVAQRKSGGGAGVASPHKVEVSYRYNDLLDYKLFMLPALIVIAITMMCGFMPGCSPLH